MKTRTLGVLVVLSAAGALTGVTLRASVPLGVFAIVERIVLEPSATEPQRIQIWGAFTAWSADRYQTAQRGYLYYSCPPTQDTICRHEWKDITSIAGTGEAIGFGERSRATGRIRRADERPASPDPYPIQFGVVKMGPRLGSHTIVDQLRATLRGR